MGVTGTMPPAARPRAVRHAGEAGNLANTTFFSDPASLAEMDVAATGMVAQHVGKSWSMCTVSVYVYGWVPEGRAWLYGIARARATGDVL